MIQVSLKLKNARGILLTIHKSKINTVNYLFSLSPCHSVELWIFLLHRIIFKTVLMQEFFNIFNSKWYTTLTKWRIKHAWSSHLMQKKTSNKVQYTLMINFFPESRHRGNLLQHTKGPYDKPTGKTQWQKAESTPSKTRNKIKNVHSHHFYSTYTPIYIYLYQFSEYFVLWP